jgi:GxxExxY protein
MNPPPAAARIAWWSWRTHCQERHELAQRRQAAKKNKRRIALTENDIAKIVVDASYHIHMRLGPGLLESVYVRILEYELTKRGLRVRREVPIPFRYDDIEFDEGFRADLIVEDKVILELKSVENTAPVHKKQVLTYLKLSEMKLGLLINFGTPLIKDGIFRLANGLTE